MVKRLRHRPLKAETRVRFSLGLPEKTTSFDLSFFLFKPQDWYVITRQRVWYRRRRMESPKVHFLRLDSIPSCNGFHTMLCIDSIHASRRDVTHEFKSIRKLPQISFLSPLHKKSTSFYLSIFLSIAKAMVYYHAITYN